MEKVNRQQGRYAGFELVCTIPAGRNGVLGSQRIGSAAVFQNQCKGLRHFAYAAQLDGGVAQKTVGNTAMIPEGSLILGETKGNVAGVIGVVQGYLTGDDLAGRPAYGDVAGAGGHAVGDVQYFCRTVEIGVFVL